MATSTEVEYGTCPCGGQYENREVEVRIKASEGVIVLPDVPQGACPQCSSRVYKAQVLEFIEAIMRDASSKSA